MNDDDVVKTFYVNRVHERIEKEMREAGEDLTAAEKGARIVSLLTDYFASFKESDPRPEVTKEKLETLRDQSFLASEISRKGDGEDRDSVPARELMIELNRNVLYRLDISQLAEMSEGQQTRSRRRK